MTCLIETFYGQYAACILLPLSTNSLCYGSNTLGVHIARGDKDCAEVVSLVADQLNLKKHKVSQECGNQEVVMDLPYNVEIHKYEQEATKNVYVMHMANKLWVRYASDVYLRPEVMTTFASNELESGYEKLTWKNPVKCNECGKYVIDYEYYSYDKYSYGERKTIIMQYICCLLCYNHLFPTKDFKVPFNKIVRKSIPMSSRLLHWRNTTTGEITFKAPNRRIPLNPDAFDCLNEVDVYHDKDKRILVDLFDSIRNDFVDELITELNLNQDYMLIDAEHLGLLAHSKGINIRFLGRITYQANFGYIREIAVILILSRSIKRLILNILNTMNENEDPKEIVISYLNQFLSVSETSTSKILWDHLSEYIQSHWDIVIERSVLIKLHLPSLLIAVCKQLSINFDKPFEVNYLSLSPLSKANLQIYPLVLDKPYAAQSLDIVITKARTLDKRSRAAHWNIKSGPERERATEYYEKAVRVAITIYGKDSIQYADTILEYAMHLESIHEEDGNPLNSRWNRASLIPPSKYSESAIYYFNDALSIYENEGLHYKKIIECMLGLGRLMAEHNVILTDTNRKRRP